MKKEKKKYTKPKVKKNESLINITFATAGVLPPGTGPTGTVGAVAT